MPPKLNRIECPVCQVSRAIWRDESPYTNFIAGTLTDTALNISLEMTDIFR